MVEASGSDCRNARVTLAPGPSGLIASTVTEETGCGTTDRPWLIDARPGQKVNFTLFDFGIARPNASLKDMRNPHCHVYIIIKVSYSPLLFMAMAKVSALKTSPFIIIITAGALYTPHENHDPANSSTIGCLGLVRF